MTFNNLQFDNDCNCIEDAVIDTENEFIRKLRKDDISEKDFLNHWERGIGIDSTECKDICSYKGISVNNLTNSSLDSIINIYKTTFTINPKKGSFVVQFKFKNNAGKIKCEPTEEAGNNHFNFYKSDDFSLEKIDVMDIIKFV